MITETCHILSLRENRDDAHPCLRTEGSQFEQSELQVPTLLISCKLFTFERTTTPFFV